ncbi:hypothetical protein BG015_004330, partial [Linnemannia schmuckeri]
RSAGGCTTGVPNQLYTSIKVTGVPRGYTYDLQAYSSQLGNMCAIPLDSTSNGCLNIEPESSITGATVTLYAPCGKPSICRRAIDKPPLPAIDDGLGDLHVYTNKTTHISYYVRMSEKTDRLSDDLRADEWRKYIVDNADYIEMPGEKIEPTDHLLNEPK